MDPPPNTHNVLDAVPYIEKMRELLANPPENFAVKVSKIMDVMKDTQNKVEDYEKECRIYHDKYKEELAKVREELKASSAATQILKDAIAETKAARESYETKQKELEAAAVDREERDAQLKTVIQEAVAAALKRDRVVTESHLDEELDNVARMLTSNLLNQLPKPDEFNTADGLVTTGGMRRLLDQVVGAIVKEVSKGIQELKTSLPRTSLPPGSRIPQRTTDDNDDDVFNNTSRMTGTKTRPARQTASTLSSRPAFLPGNVTHGQSSGQVIPWGAGSAQQTTSATAATPPGPFDFNALTRTRTDPSAHRSTAYIPGQPPVHSRPGTSDEQPVRQKARTTEVVAGSTEAPEFSEAVGGITEVSGQGAVDPEADSDVTMVAAEEPAPDDRAEESLEGKPLKIDISTHARIDNSVLNARMKEKMKISDNTGKYERLKNHAKEMGKCCCWHTYFISKTASGNWPIWDKVDFDNNKKCNGCKKHRDRQCFKLINNTSGLLLEATAEQHRQQHRMDIENGTTARPAEQPRTEAPATDEPAAGEPVAQNNAESEEAQLEHFATVGNEMYD